MGGAVSTGAVCAILLFLKANYFLVSLVLAAVSLIWNGRIERRRLYGLVAGFAVVAVLFLAYLRFDAGAMLADLRMAADARSGAVSPAFVMQVFAENFPAFLILAGLAAMTQIVSRLPAAHNWVGRILGIRTLALSTMVYCAALLLVTNCQLERLPNRTAGTMFLTAPAPTWPDLRYPAVMALVATGLVLGHRARTGGG